MPAACTTQASASAHLFFFLFLFLFFSCLTPLLQTASLNFLQITSTPCLPPVVKGLISEMWDADGMRLPLRAGRRRLTSTG